MNAVVTFHPSVPQHAATAGDHREERIAAVLKFVAVDAITGGLGSKLDSSMSAIQDPTHFAEVYGASTIESIRSGQHPITASVHFEGLSTEVLADLIADFVCIKARQYAESFGWTLLDAWVPKYL